MYNLRTRENTFPLPIYPAWKRTQVGDLSLPLFRVIERDGWIAVDPKPIRKQITDLRADARDDVRPEDSEPTASSELD